jgi:hypothetical protein
MVQATTTPSSTGAGFPMFSNSAKVAEWQTPKAGGDGNPANHRVNAPKITAIEWDRKITNGINYLH